jgi:hypothetical protein
MLARPAAQMANNAAPVGVDGRDKHCHDGNPSLIPAFRNASRPDRPPAQYQSAIRSRMFQQFEHGRLSAYRMIGGGKGKFPPFHRMTIPLIQGRMGKSGRESQ